MLTPHQISTAQSCTAKISDMNDLVSKFYVRLLADYPAVAPLFHSDMTEQTDKLAKTLQFAFSKLDDLGALVGPLKTLGAQHVAYGAQPAHYDAVADSLMKTLAAELGAAFDTDAQETFAAILGLVGQVMQSGAQEAQA